MSWSKVLRALVDALCLSMMVFVFSRELSFAVPAFFVLFFFYLFKQWDKEREEIEYQRKIDEINKYGFPEDRE